MRTALAQAQLKVRALSRAIGSVNISDGATDGVLILAVALLGLLGTIQSFDTSLLISADALYPVAMLDFGVLDFRPPPPNRLVPDVAVHWVVSWFTSEITDEKVASGLILFILTVATVGVWKGPRVFALVLILLVGLGFGFVDSASHYALPLLIVAYQLSMRNRSTEALVLSLIAFSDLLALLPAAALMVDPAAPKRPVQRTLSMAVGLVAAMLYSDFGVAFVELIAVLPLWFAALLIAERLNLRVELCVVVCGVLVLAALAGIAPPRYGLTIAAGLAVAITPLRKPSWSWRYLAAPAAVAILFFATADFSGAARATSAYDCLATTLKERGIATVAVDHWAAKPLYFAAKRQGLTLTLAQTDFLNGSSHPWMAPYIFHGVPSLHGIRDRQSCVLRQEDPKYCGQDSVAKVDAEDRVCGAFDLFRYAAPVPPRHDTVPAGKTEAIKRQLGHYLASAARMMRIPSGD